MSAKGSTSMKLAFKSPPGHNHGKKNGKLGVNPVSICLYNPCRCDWQDYQNTLLLNRRGIPSGSAALSNQGCVSPQVNEHTHICGPSHAHAGTLLLPVRASHTAGKASKDRHPTAAPCQKREGREEYGEEEEKRKRKERLLFKQSC